MTRQSSIVVHLSAIYCNEGGNPNPFSELRNYLTKANAVFLYNYCHYKEVEKSGRLYSM